VRAFVPGLELSRYFYDEAVAPLLAKHLRCVVLPPYFGNTTQWADSTDLLYPRYVTRLAGLYG
jgi:hypothetical protein